MITFQDFLTESMIDKVFGTVPKATRDRNMESMMGMMAPDAKNVQVHSLEGMDPNHRIISFDNPEGEREHHIFDANNLMSGSNPYKSSIGNTAAAYSHILGRVKESIGNGQTTKFQTLHPTQHSLYKKMVQRMINHHGGGAEIEDLGIQPTLQGFDAHTFKVSPSPK